VLDFLIALRHQHGLKDSTVNQAACAPSALIRSPPPAPSPFRFATGPSLRSSPSRAWPPALGSSGSISGATGRRGARSSFGSLGSPPSLGLRPACRQPTLRLPRRRCCREEQLPNVLSREEVARFLGAVRVGRFRAMFTVMYHCGLRLGEKHRGAEVFWTERSEARGVKAAGGRPESNHPAQARPHRRIPPRAAGRGRQRAQGPRDSGLRRASDPPALLLEAPSQSRVDVSRAGTRLDGQGHQPGLGPAPVRYSPSRCPPTCGACANSNPTSSTTSCCARPPTR